MEDDELEEHVGLDGLMVKKLRKKMDGVCVQSPHRNEEAEDKVAALTPRCETHTQSCTIYPQTHTHYLCPSLPHTHIHTHTHTRTIRSGT